MNIQIVVRHLQVSESIQQSIRQTCKELFDIMEGLLAIQVVIEDINGPDKHGVDKRCHIHVRGLHHFTLDIAKVAEDINQAIDLSFMQLRAKLRCIRYQAKQTLQRKAVDSPAYYADVLTGNSSL